MSEPRPKIGYATLCKDLSRPADRRRFCYFAGRRQIQFEHADPTADYDIVVVTQSADLSQWQRSSGGKIIFDFINSDLNVSGFDLTALLRGVAKFSFRRNKYLWLNYVKLLEAMCKRADAIICTTEEQRQQILQFCDNVHIILDFQTKDVQKVKNDYARGDVFNIVWEGLPENVVAFRYLLEALKEIRKRHKIALHLVTDLYRPMGMGNIGKISTKKIIDGIFGQDKVYLYEWNSQMFSSICTSCDLAVIPLDLNLADNVGKPENKLLLFWRMGLPVVVSATPAYARAMQGAGLPMACRTTDEWVNILDRYITDENARREAGQRGKRFAEQQYGEESMLSKWDAVFRSISGSNYSM